MRKTLSILSAAALLGTVAATASAASVTPTEVDFKDYIGSAAGSAVEECGVASKLSGIAYDYAWKYNSGEGKDQKAPNGSETATFKDDEHTNTITIENSDGTYFDWSATNSIGAVIVKGGELANIYTYNPQVQADTSMVSPIIPDHPHNKPAEVSHVTFCWNEDEVDEAPVFSEETAWAAGSKYNDKKGNWATYTPYVGAGTADIFAGQHTNVGEVTFSAAVDGQVTITISLTNGAKFADTPDKANLAIQGYATAPAGNPAPGKFQYKETESGTTATAKVPAAGYYGIHANVMVPVS